MILEWPYATRNATEPLFNNFAFQLACTNQSVNFAFLIEQE